MPSIIIAPAHDSSSLLLGIKEFHTSRILLLVADEARGAAISKDLARFQIPITLLPVTPATLWEDTLRVVRDTVQAAHVDRQTDGATDLQVIVDTASGTPLSNHAASAAAFISGARAYTVENGAVVLLPILRFTYYKPLTEKKLDILKIISGTNCCSSLDELSRKTGMSLPLVSYHINGNLKSEGLRAMGLVETIEVKGRMHIQLSTMGTLLVNGLVPVPEEQEEPSGRHKAKKRA